MVLRPDEVPDSPAAGHSGLVLGTPSKSCIFPAFFAVFPLRSTASLAIVPCGPSFSRQP